MKADKIKIKNATREELVNEINMVNEELSDRMFPVSGARSQKLIDYKSEIQKELGLRDATLEEQRTIQKNIDKISKKTGFNFWDAMKYCEEHECEECPVYVEKLDKRTKEERMNGALCCENLVSK